MQVKDKVAVITGGASGIGAALARRFHAEGARGVAVADLQVEPLQAVARDIGGLAVPCNVARESDIQALVAKVEAELGPIDIFVSNAGIARLGDEDAPNEEWQLNWDIHVMAHVYAVRAVAPKIGSGAITNTNSCTPSAASCLRTICAAIDAPLPPAAALSDMALAA